MKENKNKLINEEQMLITANLNYLPPGNSVDKLRAIEDANEHFAQEEIQQQMNNLT